MKRTLLSAVLVAALVMGARAVQAASFTYHGTLQDSGRPAEGSYDIELTLYSAPSGGSVIAGPLVIYKVPVHGGSFSTQADFGSLTKASSQTYAAVRVRTAGAGDFASLDSRAQVIAETASVCPGAWTLQGNAGNPIGSYLGTADTQPLTFDVDGSPVGQITVSGNGSFPDAANVEFGAAGNSVGAGNSGATIGGGGTAGYTTCGADGLQPCFNAATASFATVGGGVGNTATGAFSTVAGGNYNSASGQQATVAGGYLHTASGVNAAVPGGFHDAAGGDLSFAAGTHAAIRNPVQAGNSGTCTSGVNCGDYGTFIWADASTFSDFTSTGPNQFLIQANGGMAINGTPVSHNDELTIYGNGNGGNNVDVDLFPHGATLGFELLVVGGSGTDPTFRIEETDGVSIFLSRVAIASPSGFVGLNGGGTANPLTVGTSTSDGNGAHLTAGGTWTNVSSRSFKEDFAAIDVSAVLAKVIAMPVQTWFYRSDHQEGRHMGPVAEDFAQAFGLGDNEKYIATLDESGVAFAAIQGLNQKVETENVALKLENTELRGKLDDVLARLSNLEGKQGD